MYHERKKEICNSLFCKNIVHSFLAHYTFVLNNVKQFFENFLFKKMNFCSHRHKSGVNLTIKSRFLFLIPVLSARINIL